jgi:HYR domain/Secretion system C-terminal sorting domain
MNFCFHHPIQIKKVVLLWLVTALANGISAQCSPDVVAPVVACPANTTVNVGFGTCSVVVPLLATVTDNCPAAVTLVNDAPANNEFPVGTTVVTYTGTDGAGNSASCTTKVTVSSFAAIVCNDLVQIPADPSGTTTVLPEDIAEGGPYCSSLFISLGVNGPPSPSISISGTGTFVVAVWIEVPNNGWNKCWGNINITGSSPVADIPADNQQVNIYPNPATMEVYMQLPVSAAQSSLAVRDALGRLIFQSDFSGDLYRMDTSSLGAGIYFYQIQSEEGISFSGSFIQQ